MHYLVIGTDGNDDKALERRMDVRADHIALGDKMREAGKMLFGAAILDDNGKMCGSVLICDFESKTELDEWLAIEPYVTGKVWQNIEVKRCQVGPSFIDMLKAKESA
jgi:uncharacterized protein